MAPAEGGAQGAGERPLGQADLSRKNRSGLRNLVFHRLLTHPVLWCLEPACEMMLNRQAVMAFMATTRHEISRRPSPHPSPPGGERGGEGGSSSRRARRSAHRDGGSQLNASHPGFPAAGPRARQAQRASRPLRFSSTPHTRGLYRQAAARPGEEELQVHILLGAVGVRLRPHGGVAVAQPALE